MKQVWQTDDGAVHNTQEAGSQHEAYRNHVKLLAAFLHANVQCVRYVEDAADIAEYLAAHYEIIPK